MILVLILSLCSFVSVFLYRIMFLRLMISLRICLLICFLLRRGGRLVVFSGG